MKNLYYFSTKIAVKSLNSLTTILEKAKDWSKEQNIAETDLLEKRLAPDMLPLVKQIQIASDNAKGFAARFSGQEIPSFEDNEKTLDELIARLRKTVEYVDNIDEKNFDEAHARKIVLPFFKDKYQTSEDYLRDHALPNFFFHVVTAYNILRNQGMPLGKRDYIGGLNLLDL